MAPCVNVRIDLRDLATPPQVLVREEDGGPVAFLVFSGPGFRVSFLITQAGQVEESVALLEQVKARLGEA